MRKVVLGLGISLDGYIARPDGSVDFLFMPKDYSMAPFFKTVDVAVMGRKTLEAGLKMTGGKFDNYGIKCYVVVPIASARRARRLRSDAGVT